MVDPVVGFNIIQVLKTNLSSYTFSVKLTRRREGNVLNASAIWHGTFMRKLCQFITGACRWGVDCTFGALLLTLNTKLTVSSSTTGLIVRLFWRGLVLYNSKRPFNIIVVLSTVGTSYRVQRSYEEYVIIVLILKLIMRFLNTVWKTHLQFLTKKALLGQLFWRRVYI